MKKSFPFEYERYIAGTAFLNRREKGAYMDLLCIQAGKGHLTLQEIKDILNGDFDCWEKLKSKFIEENGLYYNKKLESVKQGKHKKTEVEIIQDREKSEQILKEKRMKFYEDCKPFLAKYPKEMLREFYNYWTEKNKSGTKLRFELQQVFEISKRLVTWAKKDKEFIKAETPKTYSEMLKMAETDPQIFKKYTAIKREGERQALFHPNK
jgi:hypothetical protein